MIKKLLQVLENLKLKESTQKNLMLCLFLATVSPIPHHHNNYSPHNGRAARRRAGIA